MLTWDDIFCVKRILILEKAEAIHELDFLDGSTAMSTKVFFNVLFGD